MSFTIVLQNNKSPKNQLDKTVTDIVAYNNCVLKDQCSILDPVILIRTSDSNEIKGFNTVNYMYIETFGRYYFVSDVVSVRANVFEVHAHVDVLSTYKAEIRANNGLIGRTQLTSVGDYMLVDDVVKCRSDPHVVTQLFSNSNDKAGDALILVAAGTAVTTTTTTDTETET